MTRPVGRGYGTTKMYEQDAVTRWRHVHHFNPGARAYIKRIIRRRERREGKRDAGSRERELWTRARSAGG